MTIREQPKIINQLFMLGSEQADSNHMTNLLRQQWSSLKPSQCINLCTMLNKALRLARERATEKRIFRGFSL